MIAFRIRASTAYDDATRTYLVDHLDDPQHSTFARVVQIVLIVAVLGSTLLTIIETMPEMRDHRDLFVVMDCCITTFFTLEFMLRLRAAECVFAFLINPYTLVDIIAVIPGYVELWLLYQARGIGNWHKMTGSMRTFRMIRVVRLIRIIRVLRDSQSAEQVFFLLRVIGQTGQSVFVGTALAIASIVLLAATLVYFFEAPVCLVDTSINGNVVDLGGACPGGWHFNSIPLSAWWSIVTLTTVGYGDVVPTSVMGKLIGGMLCLAAALILCVSAALFTVNFQHRWVEEVAERNFRRKFEEDDDAIREYAEIHVLVNEFQERLDELLLEMRHNASDVVCGNVPAAIAPLLLSVEEQGALLTSDIRTFFYEVLASNWDQRDGNLSGLPLMYAISGEFSSPDLSDDELGLGLPTEFLVYLGSSLDSGREGSARTVGPESGAHSNGGRTPL